LRGEFGDEVGGDFVGTGSDRGAYCGQEIDGLAAGFVLHAADRFLGDAGKGAAPAGMDGGDRAFFRIDEEYRHAIGGLDGEEQAGAVGDGGIAFAGTGGWLRENTNYVRVDLLEGNEIEIGRTEGGLKVASIFEHVFASVPLHKAEIEDFFGFERTCAAGAGAEAVDEPGELAEGGELQNLQAAELAKTPWRGNAEARSCRGRGFTRATPR
jgi:hypothetical protein